jgi:hypothetical protein
MRVYDPQENDTLFPEVLAHYMHKDESLAFAAFDLVQVTIESLKDKEETYEQVLSDPVLEEVARQEIVQLWAETICERIVADVAQMPVGRRPIVILYGVAALHPLGTPTQLMQLVAETEPRDERTGRAIPIVVFVPGYLPQYKSGYHFLDRESPVLSFYLGESV